MSDAGRRHRSKAISRMVESQAQVVHRMTILPDCPADRLYA